MDYAVPLLLAQISLASVFILFASRLLKHLGQASIVPQILGGLILGRSFLGRFGGFSAPVYPLKSLIMPDTLSVFGFMFYFSLIGVQMDPWILLKEIGKKEFTIGFSTAVLVVVLSISCSILIMVTKISMPQKLASSLPVVATTSAVLAFPIVVHYLTELKTINSEFGRMALSSSII
ncbi:unnamed protein product [Ilex paraguariensis]|uniref:Cation/H+ exchanger domain-containing protein n=1 Tax=Ilex paraguariensis TaxID=185542 RepID=A0ABC8USD4_9AQUA